MVELELMLVLVNSRVNSEQLNVCSFSISMFIH